MSAWKQLALCGLKSVATQALGMAATHWKATHGGDAFTSQLLNGAHFLAKAHIPQDVPTVEYSGDSCLTHGAEAWKAKDYQRSLDWLAKGVEKGSALCKTFIGNHFLFGCHVEHDPQAAFHWYADAISAGEKDIAPGNLIVLGRQCIESDRIDLASTALIAARQHGDATVKQQAALLLLTIQTQQQHRRENPWLTGAA